MRKPTFIFDALLAFLLAAMSIALACSCSNSFGVLAAGPPKADYRVIYDGNGSTGGAAPIDGGSYASGAAVTVLGNTGSLARAGYVFSCWNGAKDGSGANYSPGSTFAMGDANVSLYASWKRASGVSVTVSIPQGGSVTFSPSVITVAKGAAFSVSVAEASYGSYAWYVDGSEIAGSSFAMAIDTSSLIAGIHELTIVVSDSLGASSSGSCRFTVTN